MSEITLYEKLSRERKALQAQNKLPDWFTTPSWQLFKEKYLYEASDLRETYQRIAETLASHLPQEESPFGKKWKDEFFDVMWKGWLACSTPVLANTGTNRGCSVSCSGQYVGDSINDFYSSYKETALMTKQGFGTSAYLGDIRPRGSEISVGGTADGVMAVFKMFVNTVRSVSQGTARRGAWAGYLPIEHGDFYEVCNYLKNNPDDLNIGWNFSNEFIKNLHNNPEYQNRWQKMLQTKAIVGKGYLFFQDKVMEQQPDFLKHKKVYASNLCTEITLPSDLEHTFSCVLSSLNLAKYDEWKDSNAVFISTVFLDCVAQDFIEKGKDIPGLEKVVRYTEKARSLGLGTLGYHSYLQSKNIAFESLEAQFTNNQIFEDIQKKAKEASQWMAKEFGEPEWCKGSGQRNTHVMAIAPNTSSALICGGVSQGIEPIVANCYAQKTSAGEIYRINPRLIELLEEKDKYKPEVLKSIAMNNGSTQHLEFLSSDEKLLTKTAYEINQEVILRQASQRQRYICQAQSLNLFFAANEREEYISYILQKAMHDPYIKSLYYMRSSAGVKASTGECISCEG